jgi:hypothetical protein
MSVSDRYDINAWLSDLYNIPVEPEKIERFLSFPVDWSELKDGDLSQLFFSRRKIVQLAEDFNLEETDLAMKLDLVSPLEFVELTGHLTTYFTSKAMSLGEEKGVEILKPRSGLSRLILYPKAKDVLQNFIKQLFEHIQKEPLALWPVEHLESYFTLLKTLDESSLKTYFYRQAKTALGDHYESFCTQVSENYFEMMVENFDLDVRARMPQEALVEKLIPIIRFQELDDHKIAFYQKMIEEGKCDFLEVYKKACQIGSIKGSLDHERLTNINWGNHFITGVLSQVNNGKTLKMVLSGLYNGSQVSKKNLDKFFQMTKDPFLNNFFFSHLPEFIPAMMEIF